MSALTATRFLGGYGASESFVNKSVVSLEATVLAAKTCLGAFALVRFRTTLPRMRWDYP
jgi:NADH:ubiquinone oxidoreductase subunit H